MEDNFTIKVPYDIYESTQEIVIIIPLWWVKKESISLKIKDYKLTIEWKRIKQKMKDSLILIKEECYWWNIKLQIDLPLHAYFDKIHSTLTKENILEIIIPKVVIPENIDIKMEK